MQMQVYKLAEHVKSKGGNITREPGPVKGGSTIIAFAQDLMATGLPLSRGLR